MENLTITQSIEIPASREQVWEVLLNDKYARSWYAEFSEGTRAITDWKEGSKVVFVDNSDCGMVGSVITNKPAEALILEFEGLVDKGTEDYDSEAAVQVKGGRETYLLTEKDGRTLLSIESDMAPEHYESMSLAWEKALQKISELAVGEKKAATA